MTRGEVRWFRFSRPDKKRPVLILSRDSTITVLDEVTIAPITRLSPGRMRAVAHAIRFALDL